MLSKVLPRESGRAVELMVFDSVPAPARLHSAATGSRSSGSGEDSAPLRERIRQLEGETATEQRAAFEAGRRQGEQQGRASVAAVLEKLSASITELTAARPEARKRAERDVVELALMIARRILHRELAVDKGALTALVRVILERMARSESWRLTLHPDFAPAVHAALPATHSARVEIVSDPSCVPGTVIFRSQDGVIDASIEAQLEEIGRGLTDRLAI